MPLDAVVAEIERLEKINQEYKKTWKWKFKWFYHTIVGRLEVLEGLKNYINTLKVKEVDLDIEKRIKECPFRRVACNRYEDTHVECDGICSWVADYPKLKELKAQEVE